MKLEINIDFRPNEHHLQWFQWTRLISIKPFIWQEYTNIVQCSIVPIRKRPNQIIHFPWMSHSHHKIFSQVDKKNLHTYMIIKVSKKLKNDEQDPFIMMLSMAMFIKIRWQFPCRCIFYYSQMQLLLLILQNVYCNTYCIASHYIERAVDSRYLKLCNTYEVMEWKLP